jgi:hypothetical protein
MMVSKDVTADVRYATVVTVDETSGVGSWCRGYSVILVKQEARVARPVLVHCNRFSVTDDV